MERTPGTTFPQAASPSSTRARAISAADSTVGAVTSTTTASVIASLLPGSRTLRPGDDLRHDLRGPAGDGQRPQVAPGPGHVALGDVPHAAVELHAVVGHLLRQLAGHQLGHG